MKISEVITALITLGFLLIFFIASYKLLIYLAQKLDPIQVESSTFQILKVGGTAFDEPGSLARYETVQLPSTIVPGNPNPYLAPTSNIQLYSSIATTSTANPIEQFFKALAAAIVIPGIPPFP